MGSPRFGIGERGLFRKVYLLEILGNLEISENPEPQSWDPDCLVSNCMCFCVCTKEKFEGNEY